MEDSVGSDERPSFPPLFDAGQANSSAGGPAWRGAGRKPVQDEGPALWAHPPWDAYVRPGEVMTASKTFVRAASDAARPYSSRARSAHALPIAFRL